MPSKSKKSKGVSFQLVARSYEDQNYGDGPSHVWVPTSEIMKHTQRDVGRSQASRRYKDPESDPYYFDMQGMGEADDDELGIGSTISGGRVGPDADLMAALMKKDMQEDYTNKRNMLMADDTREGDEDIFADAVEVEDFGQDFIQQMIYGEGGEEDEEDIRLKKAAAREARKKLRGERGEGEDDDDEDEDYDDDDMDFDGDGDLYGADEEEEEIEYPKHDTTNSVLDRQFDRMLREFEVDATLNNHEVIDPRVQGTLQVEQYAPLLEEFADDHARTNFVTDEHLQHRGLINGLRKLTRENRVFDHDEKGMFFTGALPDKATRLRQVFKDEAELNRENTLKLLQREEDAIIAKMAQGMHPSGEDPDNVRKIVMDAPKKRAEFDAETILTTYSTLYNHPNVIGAKRKKLDPKAALKSQQAEMRARHLAQSQQHKKEVEAEACESADEEDEDAVTLDISERPKDETAEEKKLRRALVKQLQREKRQQKKELTQAYKQVGLAQKSKAGEKKQQKAQMTLSMAARV